MAEKQRILVLEGSSRQAGDLLQSSRPDWDLVRVNNAADGLALLHAEHFDAVYADTSDPAAWGRAEGLLQAERILDALADGVAVVRPDLQITWANRTFEAWCDGPVVGRGFYDALGCPQVLGPDYCPFQTALTGKPVCTRVHCRDSRYLELHITPIHNLGRQVTQLISLGRDVTAEVQQQQKLDALHRAGSELAALTPEQLCDMSVEERIEILKQNIRRLTHDLLHYDVIEVRLLDPQTRRLDPLLHEGMTQGAAGRVLYAERERNGITGYVAAVGKSYLCPDTSTDPRYVEGASGARSSMTVPLVVNDKVIGTFNVESPQLNAFGEDDLKFAEILSREIASALHTLQLLTAQSQSTASQSVEAISREVALPVDEILTAGTAVLERYIGHDPEIADRLQRILSAARSIKQCIQKVGDELQPPGGRPVGRDTARPRLKGLRILVADNDERVRRTAHAILGRYGCVVETARDGKEALTMARLSTYDVILADIRLPDFTGYDAYRKVREAQPGARVILMTAYGYDPSHSIVKARQEGLRFVLFKPFRIDQLLEALDSPAEASPHDSKCGA